METMSYVYVRILLVPGPDYWKTYVGSTSNMDSRDGDFYDINNPYGAPLLDEARIKYGTQDWIFFKYPIGYGDSEALRPLRLMMENYYISYYDSINNGFNMRGPGGHLSDTHKKNIGKSHRKKLRIEYSNGKTRRCCCQQKAAKLLKVSETTISRYLGNGATHKNGWKLVAA